MHLFKRMLVSSRFSNTNMTQIQNIVDGIMSAKIDGRIAFVTADAKK